jgi:hypothetical protein
MRDPVERTIRHYWHAVRWHSERRGLFEAVHEEAHYRAVSNYAMQLERFFGTFARECVLTLTFEEMIADPVRTLQSVYEWLGLNPSHSPSNAMVRYQSTPSVIRRDRGLPGIASLRRSWLWRTIGPHAPAWFHTLNDSIAGKKVSVHSINTDDTVRYLRSLQQEETKLLSNMLRRDFPDWTTLYGENT